MSIFSRIGDGLKAIGHFAVKAVAGVVHTVVNGVRDVWNAVTDKSASFSEKVTNAFKAVGKRVWNNSSIVFEEFGLLYEKCKRIINNEPVKVDMYTLTIELNDMWRRMNGEKEHFSANSSAADSERQKFNEALQQVSDMKKAMRLKQQTEQLNRMLEHAIKVENTESMQNIQQLARMKTAVKFMQALLEKDDLATDEEERLLFLIERFFYSDRRSPITDAEIIELDLKIEKLEGRGLLAIGHEIITGLYRDQVAELKQTIEEQEERSIKLDKDIRVNENKDEGVLAERNILEAEIEANKELLLTSQTLLMIIEGFQFVYDHETEFYGDGMLAAEKYILNDCLVASNTLIQMIQDTETIEKEPLRKLESLGHTIRYIQQRYLKAMENKRKSKSVS